MENIYHTMIPEKNNKVVLNSIGLGSVQLYVMILVLLRVCSYNSNSWNKRSGFSRQGKSSVKFYNVS